MPDADRCDGGDEVCVVDFLPPDVSELNDLAKTMHRSPCLLDILVSTASIPKAVTPTGKGSGCH